MSRHLLRFISLVCCLGLFGCKQPFEPQGTVANKLIMYSYLASQTDTQFVRLATTYAATSGPATKGALVELLGPTGTIRFRDTTVQWLDTRGNISPMNAYVAYRVSIKGGERYRLQAQTPDGLSASAYATALAPPIMSDRAGTRGRFRLDVTFGSVDGACVLRFYVDYYVLIDNGWELRREEVPSSVFVNTGGDTVFVYPQLVHVKELAGTSAQTTFFYDSLLYSETLSRIHDRYPTPVVYLQLEFIFTQIDETLYAYYYLNNGTVDRSTVRLDQLDFTNVDNGYGVFGSRVEASHRIVLIPSSSDNYHLPGLRKQKTSPTG